MMEVISDVMVIGFLASVGYAVILHTARSPRVTMDTIYGAACVYFMLGLLWTSFYRLVFIADPESFRLPDTDAAVAVPGAANAWFGYFSMITLATIGYGDITPVSPAARSLAMLEGLTGQLYLAITIARLVGLQITLGDRRPPTRS
jgi:hypothetical protein